jgi:hypothetical protein
MQGQTNLTRKNGRNWAGEKGTTEKIKARIK